MPTKIFIGQGETQLWEKLEQMTQIDPSVNAGISQVVIDRRLASRHVPLDPLNASGYEEIHEIDSGFCVHITDAFIAREWRLTVRCRDNNVRFRIAFEGEASYFQSKNRLSDESLGCSYIIRPAEDLLTASFVGGRQYRYCSLNVTQQYLAEKLGLAGDELPPMLLSHWRRREAVMGHFPVSRATLALAGRFFGTKSSNHWRDLEVRAISFDLLRAIFENWRAASPQEKSSMRITPLERDKLTRIRDMIRAQPSRSLTMSALGTQYRMNPNKIHHGFKRLCGVSVHDFQTELRMQLALQLLRSTPLSIAQIAERSGFSEHTNFTAAFKKHFAVLPKQVREAKSAK